MKYLVITDLHLGDPRFDGGHRLLGLLNSEQFDHLVLGGDIWDAWLTLDPKDIYSDNQGLINSLRKINESLPVTWVYGNHEMLKDAVPCIGGMKFLLPKATIVEKLVLPLQGMQQACVIHGYQIENKWLGLGRFLARVNIGLFALFGIDVQKWFRGRLVYKERYRELQNQYAAKVCPGRYLQLIMGHTHIPDQFIAPNQIKITNAGDWLWHSSYVTISTDTGEVLLHGA
jgi:UDP-2,3-diacylglucosamine pyrophosphatase LpxH